MPLVLVLATFLGAASGASTATDAPAAAVESPDAGHDSGPGDEGTGDEDEDEPLTPLELLSRFHPSVVHVPLGWLLLLWITDVATLVFGRKELLRAGAYLAALTLLSFLPAVITGILRLGQLPQEPAAVAPILRHRNIMFIGAAASALLLAIRLGYHNELIGKNRWVYLLLVTATLVLVTYGGHLGGKLVFGDDYLPF